MYCLQRSRAALLLAASVVAAGLSAPSEAQVSAATYYLLATNEPASSTGSIFHRSGHGRRYWLRARQFHGMPAE